jgi:hypothetical protein
MRTFTWSCGGLTVGLELTYDERLDAVVFLGEEGRGRRYEKVGLDRRNPAQVEEDGRVKDAFPRKVTLPASGGKPEKSFYMLEKPKSGSWDILVRVNTYSSYRKNGSGRWNVVAGSPETLIAAYGAFGVAGRVGNWDDGLVRMRPGDVLKVHPSRSIDGVSEFALWVDEDGEPKTTTWQEYENLKVATLVAEIEDGWKRLDIAFGAMPAMTYVGCGKFEQGIEVGTGVTGPAVVLGENGRGREKSEVAIVGFTPGERLETAAIAKLSEEEIPGRWYGDKSTIKTIWGLTQAERPEEGAVLVRVSPPFEYRVHNEVKRLRGTPTLLAAGNFAEGDAGYMESTPDELWVLKPGDSLRVGTNIRPFVRVIENVHGKLKAPIGEEWEERDGKANPAAYVEKGRAPWSHVPAEWTGRFVLVERWVNDRNRYKEPVREMRSCEKGRLIEIRTDSIVLNIESDDRDRRLVTVTSGVWVVFTWG